MLGKIIEPFVIQGGEGPCFTGNGDSDFYCKKCENLLVKSFNPRQLIAIGIECFKCRYISVTPGWDISEPLPNNLVTLGNSGKFMLKETVRLQDSSLTTDAEIERVKRHRLNVVTPAKLAQTKKLDYRDLKYKLNYISDGDFDIQLKKARVAREAGNGRFLNCPIAWAVDKLGDMPADNFDARDQDTAMALLFIQQADHLISKWEGHPLFHKIFSRAILYEYHHTVAQLATCSYLEDIGNKVGFTDSAKEKGKSPDLFVNIGPTTKISIEIKIIDSLHWPGYDSMNVDLERKVLKVINSAKDQLTGNAGGIVVIGANGLDPTVALQLEGAIDRLTNVRKTVSSKIAAVVSTCGVGRVTERGGYLRCNLESEWRFNTVLNPKFEGENPVKI